MRAESPSVDLNNCASEPIHFSGQIQSAGGLVVFDRAWRVRRVSANLAKFFDEPAGGWFGAEPEALFSPDAAAELRAREGPVARRVRLEGLELLVHFNEREILVDVSPDEGIDLDDHLECLSEDLQRAVTSDALFATMIRGVQVLSGFARVMLYRFDENWNGQVIAEIKAPNQEPFLHLHYPASDIPAQARALYERGWLRLIPDVAAAAVPVLSAPALGPCDLGPTRWRSVSPLHLEYLTNMGVAASMSLSVKKEGRLWGLIACHHPEPRQPSARRLAGLTLLAKLFSAHVSGRARRVDVDYRARLGAGNLRLTRQMRAQREFIDGLGEREFNILSLIEGASGAAVFYRGELTAVRGQVPPAHEIEHVVRWLNREPRPVFATTSLSREHTDFLNLKHVASGLLAIAIPEPEPSFVLWFKPEVEQTVDWGGDPNKAVVATTGRLSPRRSFAKWREDVRETALPWAPEELEAVEALRRAIVEVDLERQVTKVTLSNQELDHFVDVVAHDLKEPLRGINAFAGFIANDLAETLDPESAENLSAIRDLTRRSQLLLRELYEYSRVARIDLAIQPVDLVAVLCDVQVLLALQIESAHATIRVQNDLPVISGDPTRIQELFVNLVGNAIKYNVTGAPLVEVGQARDVNGTYFFVRDNGIGIDPGDQERVFKMFERLHAPDAFGGGTGAGLAIVKRIIDRHAGRIWLESEPGRGACFCFRLAPVEG